MTNKSHDAFSGDHQESVWNYPRPPRVDRCEDRIRVVVGSVVLADSTRTLRVLETSHPPTYYIPPEDIDMICLQPSEARSWCEWKGTARYFDVCADGRRILQAAWSYPEPTQLAQKIQDHVAFYPSKVDACYVNGERVRPQPGDFYGGWITSRIVGPFKGGPGTSGW